MLLQGSDALGAALLALTPLWFWAPLLLPGCLSSQSWVMEHTPPANGQWTSALWKRRILNFGQKQTTNPMLLANWYNLHSCQSRSVCEISIIERKVLTNWCMGHISFFCYYQSLMKDFSSTMKRAGFFFFHHLETDPFLFQQKTALRWYFRSSQD